MIIGLHNYPYDNIPPFEYNHIKSLDINNIDKLLVYWKKSLEGEKSSFEQLALIDLCLKKDIPIVIIDLNKEMSYNEALTCIKSNIKLFEPYIITRELFCYLPEPVSLEYPSLENSDNRVVNVCYHTTPGLKFPSIDIKIIDRIFAEAKIYLNCDNSDYRKYGRISQETFKAASAGCMPLIPIEHRLMHGLVSTVGNPINVEDIQYYVNRSTAISYGYCYNFIENVRKVYPEFGYEYFKEVILNANSGSQI